MFIQANFKRQLEELLEEVGEEAQAHCDLKDKHAEANKKWVRGGRMPRSTLQLVKLVHSSIMLSPS